MTATERFNDICKANADAAQQYAAFTWEGAERVFKLQADAAKGFYAVGTRQFLDLMCGEAARPIANWPKLVEKSMERAVEITRAYVNSATELQNDLTGIFQEQLPAINRNIVQSVEQFSHMMAVPAKVAEGEAKRMGETPEHRAKKAA